MANQKWLTRAYLPGLILGTILSIGICLTFNITYDPAIVVLTGVLGNGIGAILSYGYIEREHRKWEKEREEQ